MKLIYIYSAAAAAHRSTNADCARFSPAAPVAWGGFVEEAVAVALEPAAGDGLELEAAPVEAALSFSTPESTVATTVLMASEDQCSCTANNSVRFSSLPSMKQFTSPCSLASQVRVIMEELPVIVASYVELLKMV